MTSTEFAAKYRLLKNVATRGARSFLAQQVELGRMVMVHYLDSEDAEGRAATLARLESLPTGNHGKLLEIAEVDGTPVAVTLFISSFKDFATWLDSVSAPAPHAPAVTPKLEPADFSQAFRIEPPSAPAMPEPIDKPKPLEKSPGDFTRIFGKVDETPVSTTLPPVAKPGAANANEDETPTMIMEAVKSPHVPAPTAGRTEPPAEPDSGSSFTAIFGSLGASSHPAPDLSQPLSMPAPPAGSVMPAAPAPFDFRPTAPSPVPQAPAAPEPGEFTQLFQRLSPGGGLTPPPIAAPPFTPPDIPKPIPPTPRADAPPPVPSLGAPALNLPPLAAPAFAVPTLGAPSLGAPPLGAPAQIAPQAPDHAAVPNASALPPLPSLIPPSIAGAVPPRSWGTPAAPPPIGASVFGNSAPSEFTRMLKPIAPPPPPVSIQPPAGTASPAASGAKRSILPLIIGLTAVVLLTVVIVVYFVVRAGRG